jgi:hypothetical protein
MSAKVSVAIKEIKEAAKQYPSYSAALAKSGKHRMKYDVSV